MTLTTFIYGALCFGAGVVAGIFLNDSKIVTAEDVKSGSNYLLTKFNPKPQPQNS